MNRKTGRFRKVIVRIKRRMIMEEKNSLLEMYQSGTISFEVYETIRHELDSQLFELENMGV